MSYLDELNLVQKQAAMATEGPVLVVAGPGSGKTRVLTYRIAHIIEKGAAPWEVLALTFTNKAAREMKERIAKVVGNRAEQVWAGTFHSIFSRILRVEADKIGYNSNFTIYDTEDTNSVINSIIKEMNLDKQVYNTNAIRARISSAKSNLITPKLYQDNEQLISEDRIAKRPLIVKIYEQYVARCKRSGAMDFDDLLYRLYELLQKDEETLQKYRKKFRYLLVDEFQDTNHLQYSIIKKLVQYEGSPRNICVVGDDAQSIYGFRGATIQNILDFENDFKPYGIQVFKLEQNYRSTDHIVQAANEVIAYNRRQIQKKIWSDKGDGHRIKVIKALTDTEEGKRIADTIVEQKNRFHLRNSDIAILYRTNAQSRIFEEYLRRYNIAYRVFGGLSFYQRKEVKDLLAYLRLAVNRIDEEALRRVINYPRRGIGDTTVDKFSAYASQHNTPMWEALGKVNIGGRTQNALHDFITMINDFGAKAQTNNAYDIALYVAKRSGIIDELKNDTTIEGAGRLENVNALLDGIQAFVQDDFEVEGQDTTNNSLAAYLQNIALITDLDNESAEADHVTLMSVHSAKGLEFKSVFVVGLEENLFPSFLSNETIESLDEERRLFYVAITRAEEYLTLSYATQRYRYGTQRMSEPSRFLNELPPQSIESTTSVRSNATYEEAPMARVLGNFARKNANPATPAIAIDPANFKPSPTEKIQPGMTILHLKFGEGKVLSIDGNKDNPVATIHFKDIEAPQQRRIMLKYAKVQILSES
ncbi:MAG: ATP-dependent helicase [Saprospiraceae bacterium]